MSKFIKIQKMVDNYGQYKLYCTQLNRHDRGAVIISILTKPTGIGEGKGITAEGFCSFLAAGLLGCRKISGRLSRKRSAVIDESGFVFLQCREQHFVHDIFHFWRTLA